MSGVMANMFRRSAVPLGSYYCVTIALPLANGAAHAGMAFVEHAAVVLVIPPLLIALACTAYEIGRRCIHGVRRFMQRCA